MGELVADIQEFFPAFLGQLVVRVDDYIVDVRLVGIYLRPIWKYEVAQIFSEEIISFLNFWSKRVGVTQVRKRFTLWNKNWIVSIVNYFNDIFLDVEYSRRRPVIIKFTSGRDGSRRVDEGARYGDGDAVAGVEDGGGTDGAGVW